MYEGEGDRNKAFVEKQRVILLHSILFLRGFSPMSGKTRLVDWGCLKGERLLQYPGFSSDKTFFELFALLPSCVDVA